MNELQKSFRKNKLKSFLNVNCSKSIEIKLNKNVDQKEQESGSKNNVYRIFKRNLSARLCESNRAVNTKLYRKKIFKSLIRPKVFVIYYTRNIMSWINFMRNMEIFVLKN